MRRILLRIGLALAAFVFVTMTGCQQRPLPEQDTYAGQLYVRQCGQCHSPYNPHSMTAAMWEIEVPKMEDKIRQSGLPALETAQKQTILEYLQRNAGQQ
jgi:Dihaem cytochrome c